MKADILTLRALFQRDIRYVIPTFQRPYVWNQDDQWEPLWNDVRNTAEEFLEELDAVGGADRPKAEEATRGHFLGAVVLQQQPTATADLETRQVIDGQQRLTTLQLLLDAAQEAFERDGFQKEARQLRKLVLNDEDYADIHAHHVFKIWPTLGDRDAFRAAMNNGIAIEGFEESPIVQAHEFFQLQIRQWLGALSEDSLRRAEALVTALLGLLRVVVIDLQSNDDPNIIFETLNARGTPLLPSDLIKNSILHRVRSSGINVDSFHKMYWYDFDAAWWRSEVRQGRLNRPRIDIFLHYWLIMRLAKEVPSGAVFPAFQEYANNAQLTVTDIAADIQAIAKSFRELEETSSASGEGTFLYRWRMADAGVATPVLLWLFSHRAQIGEEGFLRALSAVESYLMRRLICRMSTKDYNRLFLELMGHLQKCDVEKTAEAVTDHFAAQTAESRIWPTDAQVREALVSLPLYQLLTRGRLRVVLEALENALRTSKAEAWQTGTGSLTIEHIMPQMWEHHWPLPDPHDLDAVDNRRRLIHTVGNLTLVNNKLNPALSNAAWEHKRGELNKHSVLYLNKDMLDTGPAQWDEDAIGERSNRLAAIAIRCWPRPTTS